MSLLADIFIATPEQAMAYDGSSRFDDIERIQFTGLTELELALLWSIIEETEFDFDEHELEDVGHSGNTILYCFPDSFIFLLAGLTEKNSHTFAARWAHNEEVQLLTVQAEEIIILLTNLAQKALKQGKSIYLWSSL